MTPKRALNKRIDWLLLGCFLFLVVFGWMNIFSSSLGDAFSGFDWHAKYGMQIVWISSALVLALFILYVIPARFYSVFSWWMYALMILSLLAVLVIGKEVNGSKSWIDMGAFQIQPAEFSKIFTALALAGLMERFSFNFSNRMDALSAFALMAIPALLIVAEKETGLAIVYLGFLLPFYREGMTPWIILSGLIAILLFILTLVTSPFVAILVFIGMVVLYISFHSRNFIINAATGMTLILAASFLPRLGRIEAVSGIFGLFPPEVWLAFLTVPAALFFLVRSLYRKRDKHLRNALVAYLLGVALVFSVDFVFDHVLKDHQRLRIEVLLGIKDDPMGAGYNVHQSKIAIGSGGLVGKGFLHGTQTRFDFVPEQSTDFIFCTVGEEWGFLGALAVILVYAILIVRLFNSAERQKSRFSRIYGYCTASCILMHVVINLGMTIGLMPVIGIPLPFISYGGSSLWAFTILLFIFIRLDYEGRQ